MSSDPVDPMQWSVKPQTVINGFYRIIFRRSVAGFPKLEIVNSRPGRGGHPTHLLIHFNNDGDVLRIERLTAGRLTGSAERVKV